MLMWLVTLYLLCWDLYTGRAKSDILSQYVEKCEKLARKLCLPKVRGQRVKLGLVSDYFSSCNDKAYFA